MQWPLWLKLNGMSWIVSALLLWVSLVTRPYQPITPAKKLREGEIARLPSSEYSSSLYSQITFAWLNPLIYLGYKKPIQDPDLPDIESEDYSIRSIKRYNLVRQDSLFWSLFNVLKWEFFVQFLWALPWCILVNAAPFCLNRIIEYIECRTCGPPTYVNYLYVFGLLFSSLIESLCDQNALHIGRRIFVHTISICNAEVFAKTLRRKDVASPADKLDDDQPNEKKNDGTLNIANLIAVDVKKLEIPFSYVFYLYGFPIQFVIAGVQLYWLLGYASLVGIACMFLSYPIPAKLYTMIMRLFKDIMNTKDERMDALNEMLSAIRIVKFFGWESKFEERITAAREKELKRTKDSYVKMIFTEIVWMIVPLLNIVIILVVYTKVFGNEISASKMFTTLALFNIMRQSLNMLPWQIKNTMQAAVSLKRINRFLLEEDLVKDTTVTKISAKAQTRSSHPTVGFVNASYIWPNKENGKDDVSAPKEETKPSWTQRIKRKLFKASKVDVIEEPITQSEAIQERFKLKDLTIDFPVGKLSVIIGPTGSGKSALLLALLGELERLEGHQYMPRLDYGPGPHSEIGSGIAYVAQTAWLQNTSIRNNILFGSEFDQERYDAVVEGCALTTDFEIMEFGDATEIGEQGITLSGGQKQRVSLARAIYSRANVLLLDDCLSAVDTHTGKHLFQTLTGPLLTGRTILLVTHQVQLTMTSADLIVVMNKGEILGSGTPLEAIHNHWVDYVTLPTSKDGDSSEVSTLHNEEGQQQPKAKKDTKEKRTVKLTDDEKQVEGAVAWNVYKTYLIASGGWPFWIGLVILFMIREVVDVSQNAWLAIWSNKMAEATGSYAIKLFDYAVPASVSQSFYASFASVDRKPYGMATLYMFGKGTPETVNVDFYLGVYILLSILTLVFAALTNYYTIFGGLAASRSLHQQLLHKIVRAKVRFFDTTPIGRIVNRFSSDISTIDDDVSNGLQGLFGSFVTVLGIVVIISANMPLFMIPAVFIVAIYGVIGALYVPISRQMKRLNSNSRSPILNHFNEALNGLITIRAYGFEKRFLSKNLINQDNNNRTFFLLWSTNRWLHWRVDIAGALVAFATGILILQNYGRIEPGWAAMSLTYALMFTGTIVWMIRNYAQNEMNLNSVERVAEYMDLEEEPPAIIEGSRPPASWPHAGQIVVENLVMKYAPDAPAVIKNVSFKINAGEKIGVVGRTGSGKSTLAISLFRFMDPVSGTILIDGIDICKIGLQDLRSNLTIIPQDPILFKGTLRSNLDPFGEHEDRELWEALRRSHLIPDIKPSSKAASLRHSLETLSIAPVDAEASSSKSSACSIKGSGSSDNDTVDPTKITLDTPVKENGSNFSQGQRQLIALARALVRQSKIIIMDEATASVDFETDLKIQGTIRQEMTNSTIITIAHRIRTIADFDRVLVMNAGEVAEFDKPLTLMKKEESLFRSMCERSSEFEALLTIAEEKERQDAVRLS
ncbi:ABC transporter type 1, transmembrane domain-containing protein [Lobosporangium transversale]|uniref:ABC transporter type 1, transmembrane domain-containing protein n=1 Tax=Lobosporangium transversale TaxID=64571 RepID=A0A1Y2G914_9FUNG|nr:ABC transporter type 1, transmembrane domain-containing protein [Lobosporangium transversale]ORZ04563.1 ABC transporter type 1, transmembrane domain-containing protein [Lobosporangium transversale]|eukprot:XP_021876609.1 ABC transporter type 1, transmembrane domain-containing protein [Lobosporangium transversale]